MQACIDALGNVLQWGDGIGPIAGVQPRALTPAEQTAIQTVPQQRSAGITLMNGVATPVQIQAQTGV